MPPNVAVGIELSDQERLQLQAWTRRRTSAQALALRSRIVLAAAEGLRNTEIAERLGINRAMAAKWRSRFAEQRLDGLTDEPRPGRPRTITDEQVDAVITTTLESTPKEATHWSTRSMAKEVGLTQTAVSRIWRAFGLQPHRQDSFKLSKDPLFVDKVHDVVGLYLNRPSAPSCSASMRSPRSRRWIGPRRSCRCSREFLSARPTTTAAPAPQASTPRWTSPAARSSAPCTAATARSSSSSSCRPSTAKFPPISRSTSCSTTAAPTRHQRSRSGYSRTPASSCTSPRPQAHG